mgnify:CR=1 FL=1
MGCHGLGVMLDRLGLHFGEMLDLSQGWSAVIGLGRYRTEKTDSVCIFFDMREAARFSAAADASYSYAKHLRFDWRV